MDNPVKIIYKYKNNKNRIQYQLYIFIGSLIDNNVIKILTKIQKLSFYDTLIYLTSKDIELLNKYYGDKWYYKLFILNHIKTSINSINNNNQMKNTLIEKLGKEWFDNHILINYSNKVKGIEASDIANKGRGEDAIIGSNKVEIKSSKGNTINTQLQTTWDELVAAVNSLKK